MGQVQATPTPGRTSSGTTLAASFAATPTVGNKIIVYAWGFLSGLTANPTCSDNQTGNTYARDSWKQNGTGVWCAIFSAQVNGASGTFTVTVNNGSGNADVMEVVAVERDDIVASSPLDGVPTSASGTSTSPAPGSLTTTNANDYLAAVMVVTDSSATATVTTPTGYTTRQKETNSSVYIAGEGCDEVVSATGAQNPTWTTSSFAWACAQAAYKLVDPSTLEQEGYRFRNDDGNEAAATFKAAQDTAITEAIRTRVRPRIIINATNDPTAKQFQLEWRLVGGDGVWRKVDK